MNNFRIYLKANERLYINGAVVRTDRKVGIELMNDAVFLLEGHVLQEEDATTDLRRFYFLLQSMLMEPLRAMAVRSAAIESCRALGLRYRSEDVGEGLLRVELLLRSDKLIEAMKELRDLYLAHEAQQQSDTVTAA